MANSILASMAVALTANVSDFNRGMASAKKELAGFKKAGEEMKSFGENLSKYISAPLAGIAAVSLKTFANIEALKKGLVAVAGTAEAADKQFASLKEVAKLPGLGLEEAIQGSINLQAAGFSAEQAEGALKGFGNALATVGKGKAELDGVTTALSQMAAKGKISAEEINQIAERVPQIRKVMQKAFGTSNTEELQKMGITATQFVEQVNNELAKLPPVAGGLNNAFENLADSGKLAFASLGETISKTFNIEGLLNGIADRITGIAEAFNTLSPGMQRFIVIGAGVAAAIGPLLFAFGALSAAIPTLIAGATALGAAFTVMTGPIGIAALAVAAGVALIISNWDVIKAYFTTGGGSEVFNKLSATASAAFDRIKEVFSAFISFTLAVWERYGADIIAVAKFFLAPIVTLFKVAFQGIGMVLDVFRAGFEMDWKKLWQAVKNIAAIAVNGIIDLIAGMATAIPRILGGVMKGLGIDNAFTKGLKTAVGGVQTLADRFKMQTVEVYKSTLAVKDNANALDGLVVSSNKAAAGFAKAAEVFKDKRQNYKINYEEGIVVAPEKMVMQLELLPIDPATFQQVIGPTEQAMIDFVERTQDLVRNGLVDAFVLLGNTIGQAMAGGTGSMESFLNGFLGLLANFLGEFGQMLIKAGMARVALDKLIVTPGAGPLAIVAGVALVALAGAAKSHLSKGMGGAGAGGGSTPTPSSRPFTGGDYGNGKVEFKISGDALVGVINRQDYRTKRFGG